MAKFEAHITASRDDANIVQNVGESVNWSFSVIDGDALMGQQPYCYLTQYDKNGVDLFTRAQLVIHALAARGVTMLRLKIERIVYDTKTAVNELGE